MNFIFTAILIVSIAILSFVSPEAVIAAMTDGAYKAVTLSLTLTAVYSVWSGVSEVMEKCGINEKIAKILSPVTDFLFGRPTGKLKKQLSLNISANLFGLGGIATPAGIASAKLLSDKNDRNGMEVLFVLAATSLQLLPTTVIALRQQYGSFTPSDIFLSTLLSTAISTATGLLLLKLTRKRR